MNAILLARITVKDGMGNASQLDVRRAENDELVLSYFNGSTALSLSNMQPKKAPPAFCVHGDDAATVDMVAKWLECTLIKVQEVERGPSAC